MRCKAFRVVSVEDHPNADTLKVYQFEISESETIQVIANLDNTYEVGDVVAVALVGATLKDGTKLGNVKLRGVPSYGMALGKVSVPVGTDLTTEYCIDRGKYPHVAWPSIESLFNINKYLRKANDLKVVDYRAKIKLDGCNTTIQLTSDGSIIAGSRSRNLTVDDDHYGFAKFVASHSEYFKAAKELMNNDNDVIVVFGEWAGSGIQKRTAISSIDKKILAIFAVQFGTVNPTICYDPAKIREWFPDHEDIFVLPWDGELLNVNFSDSVAMKVAVENMNRRVLDVEKEDPWVKETFGISGLGEGLVYYPILKNSEGYISREDYTNLVFKAKGDAHKVVKTKKAVQINPEVAKDIEEFADLFVTDARLDQILERVGAEVKNTGAFIKEFTQDVFKESAAELEAAGLEWKNVSKVISARARIWFLNKVKESL